MNFGSRKGLIDKMVNQKNEAEIDEIDLVKLVRLIWIRRKFIIYMAAIFAIIGLFIAFTAKVEYMASCKLMPETNDGSRSNLGGLSGLAGLAGIDLGNAGSGALSPHIYPEIVGSVPFQISLINEPIRFEKIDSTVSSYTYFTEIDRPSLLTLLYQYSVGLPAKIKSLLNSSEVENRGLKLVEGEIINITKSDNKLLERYGDRLDVSVDSKTGIISVSGQMPDPFAAAILTEKLVENLKQSITDYRIEKAKANLDFVQKRYSEAEQEYRNRQREIAYFSDRNKNVTSSFVQSEYQRLQNDVNIAFEVSKGLRTQLEQAKIQVKKETPVFTILEPVKVPVEKSSPRRAMILVIATFIGGTLGSAYIIFRYGAQAYTY